MKRVFLFISILLCLTAGYAQKEYNGGNKDPNPSLHQDFLDDTSTSGGISADPNESIGPMGYNSIHWVSVKDVLNYTCR